MTTMRGEYTVFKIEKRVEQSSPSSQARTLQPKATLNRLPLFQLCAL